MTDENSGERVCVVIDEANLYLGFRRFGFDNCRLDELSLVDTVSKGRNVVDMVIVDSYRSEPDSKSDMLDILENKGFRLVTRICDGKQKGVDCDMNNVIVEGAIWDLYDTVVIVSGDGDMTPAAEKAHEYGKRVEVACFGKDLSMMLANECDFYHPLEKIKMVDARKMRDAYEFEEETHTYRQSSLYEFMDIEQACAY